VEPWEEVQCALNLVAAHSLQAAESLRQGLQLLGQVRILPLPRRHTRYLVHGSMHVKDAHTSARFKNDEWIFSFSASNVSKDSSPICNVTG